MMKRILIVAVLGLAGCASMPGVFSVIPRPEFPINEYQALPRTGAGVVTGQAFLRTMIGEVRYAAGSEVILNPVTSYSTFWYDNDYAAGGRRLAPPDPRMDEVIHTTQADGEGRFTFRNVPPGEYYAVSGIFWYLPQSNGAIKDGGWVAKRIRVSDAAPVEVILTR